MKRKDGVVEQPSNSLSVGNYSNAPNGKRCDSLSGQTKGYTWETLHKPVCGRSAITQPSSNYLTDENTNKGSKSVEYSPTLQAAGNYEVYLWWPTDASGATNVPVDITTGLGTSTVTVNQTQPGGEWVAVGTFNFTANTATMSDSYTYDAFGNEVYTSGGTTNPFQFEGPYGYYQDSATRYYVQQRHLHTVMGRWMSEDPLGFVDGPNLYSYCGNDPVNMVDPSGLESIGTWIDNHLLGGSVAHAGYLWGLHDAGRASTEQVAWASTVAVGKTIVLGVSIYGLGAAALASGSAILLAGSTDATVSGTGAFLAGLNSSLGRKIILDGASKLLVAGGENAGVGYSIAKGIGAKYSKKDAENDFFQGILMFGFSSGAGGILKGIKNPGKLYWFPVAIGKGAIPPTEYDIAIMKETAKVKPVWATILSDAGTSHRRIGGETEIDIKDLLQRSKALGSFIP